MYRVNDKAETVRQIQRMLAYWGCNTVVNGVYDDNTRTSVINFQHSNGLNPDGRVDKKTLDLLYEACLKRKKRKYLAKMLVPAIEFPLSVGRSENEMISINRLVADLLDYYGISHSIIESSYYSSETARCVMLLKEIFLMEKDDNIDEIFYLRMIDEYKSIGELNIVV